MTQSEYPRDDRLAALRKVISGRQSTMDACAAVEVANGIEYLSTMYPDALLSIVVDTLDVACPRHHPLALVTGGSFYHAIELDDRDADWLGIRGFASPAELAQDETYAAALNRAWRQAILQWQRARRQVTS